MRSAATEVFFLKDKKDIAMSRLTARFDDRVRHGKIMPMK